jgi:hypothetical protein
MTSKEMLIQFKVILDKVDSQSYPDFHPEQIYLFINKAVNEYVLKLRRVFEENQQLADDGKALMKEVVLDTTDKGDNIFSVAFPSDYVYLLRCSATTVCKGNNINARLVYTQQDDIEVVLDDPFNKPKPHKLPYTFNNKGLNLYCDKSFEVSKVKLVYLREPIKIDASVSCDLDKHVHQSIIDRAVELAIETIESPRSQTFNK